MSADLSAEISALTLHASASASASASGSATPSANRSAAGSPPSAGADQHGQQAHAQALSGEEGERVEFEEAAMATPDGVKTDRRHARSGRQLDASERRTIFIPNLPRDATIREVSNMQRNGVGCCVEPAGSHAHSSSCGLLFAWSVSVCLCFRPQLTNMFAFADGFVKVQLYDQQNKEHTNGKEGMSPGGNGGVGKTEFGAFALFSTAAQAAAARDRLHGMPFDSSANPPVILQARLALKNLFMSRDESEQYSAKSSRRGSHIYGHGQVIPIDSPYTAAPINANGHFNVSPLLSPQHPANAFLHTGYNSPALGPFSQQLTPPALQSNGAPYFTDSAAGVLSPHHSALAHNGVFSMLSYANGNGANVNGGGSYGNRNGHHSAHTNGHHSFHHGHGRHSAAGPFNAPCNTLFLARLDALTNDGQWAGLASWPRREHSLASTRPQSRCVRLMAAFEIAILI